MSQVVSLVGNDTLQINDRVLLDLADGDVGALTFPNDVMGVKTGKNGNSLYAFNASGLMCELILRIIRGSDDDKYLNTLLLAMIADVPSFILMTSKIVKRVGDGQGDITNDTYALSGGVFTKQVETKSNVEGDTEQSLSIYHFKFTNSPRAIL